MSDSRGGAIVWQDLTVAEAGAIKDFYSKVTGWGVNEEPMGDYVDYSMSDQDGNVVAGICHARGSNAGLPPQWLVYIQVASVAASARMCQDLGGKVLDGPRRMGAQDFCVIQDPAGAVAALMGPSSED
ncbi:MAG: VOC family protein [Candidatus Delongbacteria bacterium]|nr:VOC family protein [Candidatus Cloacimonadota bacterium]MCB9474034.1 VOC family protein [Candidatus Delongbacteria bacterium]